MERDLSDSTLRDRFWRAERNCRHAHGARSLWRGCRWRRVGASVAAHRPQPRRAAAQRLRLIGRRSTQHAHHGHTAADAKQQGAEQRSEEPRPILLDEASPSSNRRTSARPVGGSAAAKAVPRTTSVRRCLWICVHRRAVLCCVGCLWICVLWRHELVRRDPRGDAEVLADAARPPTCRCPCRRRNSLRLHLHLHLRLRLRRPRPRRLRQRRLLRLRGRPLPTSRRLPRHALPLRQPAGRADDDLRRVNDGVCDCCDGADEFRSKAAEHLRRAGKGWPRRVRAGELLAPPCGEAGRRAARRWRRTEPNCSRCAAEAAGGGERRCRRGATRRGGGGGARTARAASADSADALAASLGGGIEGIDALYDALDAHEHKEAMDDVDNADLIEVAMEARDAAREAGGGGGGGTSPNPDAADAAAGECEARRVRVRGEAARLMPLHAAAGGARRAPLALRSSAADARRLSHVSAAAHPRGKALDAAAVEAVALLAGFADADAAARAALEAQHAAVAGAGTVEELAPIQALRAQLAFGGATIGSTSGSAWSSPRRRSGTSSAPSAPSAGRPLARQVQGVGDARPTRRRRGGGDRGGQGRAADVTAMSFDGGDECNGAATRDRPLRVRRGGGARTVAEPLTCVYVAVVTTPAACDVEELRGCTTRWPRRRARRPCVPSVRAASRATWVSDA